MTRLRHEWLNDQEYETVMNMRRATRDTATAEAARRGERRHTFADLNPDTVESHQRFQDVFGVHFPHLADDEHQTIIEYAWITNSIFGNPTDTTKKSGLDREFKKLRKAIQTLAEHDTGYWTTMTTSFDDGDEIDQAASGVFDFLLELNGMLPPHDYPVSLAKVLDRYEELARKAIAETPDRRNINWEAVDAVYRLRGLWWRNTGENAPSRALNPESPFANYLRDAFQFLDIKGDPISAFKRWAALAEQETYLRY